MIKAAENKDSHPKLPKTMQHFLNVTTAALKKKKKISTLYSTQRLHSLHSQLFTPPPWCPLLLMAKTSPQSAEACRQPLWWLIKERGVRTGAAGWTCLQSSCVSLSRQHTPDEPESVSPSRSQPQPPRGAPGRRGRVREGREGTRRRGEFVSECPLKAKTLSKFKSCCVAFTRQLASPHI